MTIKMKREKFPMIEWKELKTLEEQSMKHTLKRYWKQSKIKLKSETWLEVKEESTKLKI